MPYLTIGATDVDVAADGVSEEVQNIGDRYRAFDGTMRSTVRAYKSVWTVQTVPMARATADTLQGVLEGSQPISCSGDLLGGTVSCHVEPLGTQAVAGAAGAELKVVRFRLHEE